MTGQRVGMVIRPPTGGGLLAVEGWGGRCAPRHIAQAGGNAGDIGRPADQIRRKVVMSSSFNLSLHRRPGGHAAHGGNSGRAATIRQSHGGGRCSADSGQGCRERRRPGKWIAGKWTLRFPKHR